MPASPSDDGDGALLRRLRELAMVEPDGLLAAGDADGALAHGHLDHLRQALAAARTRSQALRASTGPDPYAIADLGDSSNHLEELDKAAAIGSGRLTARAAALQLAAELDGAAADLLPHLAAWARRVGGGPVR